MVVVLPDRRLALESNDSGCIPFHTSCVGLFRGEETIHGRRPRVLVGSRRLGYPHSYYQALISKLKRFFDRAFWLCLKGRLCGQFGNRQDVVVISCCDPSLVLRSCPVLGLIQPFACPLTPSASLGDSSTLLAIPNTTSSSFLTYSLISLLLAFLFSSISRTLTLSCSISSRC